MGIMHCGEGYGSKGNVRKLIIVQGKRPESNRKSNVRKTLRKTSELNGSVDRKG